MKKLFISLVLLVANSVNAEQVLTGFECFTDDAYNQKFSIVGGFGENTVAVLYDIGGTMWAWQGKISTAKNKYEITVAPFIKGGRNDVFVINETDTIRKGGRNPFIKFTFDKNEKLPIHTQRGFCYPQIENE